MIDITPSRGWYKAALKAIAERSESREDRKWAAEELKKYDACESDSHTLNRMGKELKI